MRKGASVADVEELYCRHADELRGYLYRRAGQSGIDVLQEVFVVALRRRGDLPAPELRRAWLFGTARRLLMAKQRDTRRRTTAEREAATRDTDPREPDRADRDACRDAVRAALGSLNEKDRELIRLTEWEGLQISEAAAVLGIKAGTARVRLHRARRMLASHPLLKDVPDPDADPGRPPLTFSQAEAGVSSHV
ncbi:RNA polymerase sigma factor [Nocardioides sp.]|uniref:RNA polymerase sigma factor n=1 Tax=Nocardioides sp. TaxID=35761 RepID=UPI0039E7125A